MTSILVCVLSLVLPAVALIIRGWVERVRSRISERELGFWNSDVTVILERMAVQ